MKAIVTEQYGSPEKVLALREIEQPVPKENEVLIKVQATAVNDYDWGMVRGKPGVYRLLFGLFKPKYPIAGMELSGVVEGIGAKVEQWKVGDAVYGDISQYGFGTFAEYLCIHEKAVVRKPEAFSFEEAAAIPHAALLALQALKDMGGIAPGQKVLINGGGGGVGTLGLHLAKHYGCEVTGVDAGEKLEMMQSIGFDHVIDYQKENFTKNGTQYDLILDCKTNQSAFAYLRALKPNGKYVTVGGTPGSLISLLFWGKIVSLFSSKKLQILALKPNEGLEYIEELFTQNKIKCVMDGPYALEEIPRLIRYFGEGKHKGKVVIKMN